MEADSMIQATFFVDPNMVIDDPTALKITSYTLFSALTLIFLCVIYRLRRWYHQRRQARVKQIPIVDLYEPCTADGSTTSSVVFVTVKKEDGN